MNITIVDGLKRRYPFPLLVAALAAALLACGGGSAGGEGGSGGAGGGGGGGGAEEKTSSFTVVFGGKTTVADFHLEATDMDRYDDVYRATVRGYWVLQEEPLELADIVMRLRFVAGEGNTVQPGSFSFNRDILDPEVNSVGVGLELESKTLGFSGPGIEGSVHLEALDTSPSGKLGRIYLTFEGMFERYDDKVEFPLEGSLYFDGF